MAMTVRYNGSANRALSHIDKNSKARSKSLAKVASGMKINSAADDAASYSISSRMRVKLRALDQDAQNVQNGSSILRTAEGGIQGQIDLIRTIREKVINAANDSNTDDDRLTIQKELSHLYDQMENIAYQTDFNSKKPLLGEKWVWLRGQGIDIQNSLDLIPNRYAKLDEIAGPFDVFTEYSSKTDVLGRMSGGVNSTRNVIMSMDFSGYTDVSQLNNVGITVNNSIYVFTDDMTKNYRNANKIQLGDTVDATIDNFVNRFKSSYSATRDGMKVQLKTTIAGSSHAGGTVTTQQTGTATGTGARVSGTTSGGITNTTDDVDLQPAAKATLTVDLSGVASDSGFRFEGVNFRVIDSDETIQREVNQTLTKGQSKSGTAGSFNYTFDGNSLTFTARYDGAEYNGRSIVDGYTYTYAKDPLVTNYDAYTSFDSNAIETIENTYTEGQRASWTFELSGMTVDDFSEAYRGKSIRLSATSSWYKFYDSDVEPKLESFREDDGSRPRNEIRNEIDINDLRQSVESGKSLAEALKSKLGGTVDGENLKFTYSSVGTYGNNTQISLMTETLRHYDINFSNIKVEIPSGLYGKGFRAYCATDNKEWFNFIFTDGTNSYDNDNENIKSIAINVSNVTDASKLVEAIYEQANPILTGTDLKFNHHLRFAADPVKKTLTVYDHRRFDVNKEPYTYQEMGAKIADGVEFEDENEETGKSLFVKDLVIQHTDRAGMNIHIQIPDMTLTKIFDPLPDADKTIFDYPVTDKESRNALLGNPKPPGILDNGLQYLLDAATMVGAQNRRLEFTAENISTETENLTASESVIRDADMAKEMTSYTKYNILSQAAQSMLAQANQNHSTVLSLLQ